MDQPSIKEKNANYWSDYNYDYCVFFCLFVLFCFFPHVLFIEMTTIVWGEGIRSLCHIHNIYLYALNFFDSLSSCTINVFLLLLLVTKTTTFRANRHQISSSGKGRSFGRIPRHRVTLSTLIFFISTDFFKAKAGKEIEITTSKLTMMCLRYWWLQPERAYKAVADKEKKCNRRETLEAIVLFIVSRPVALVKKSPPKIVLFLKTFNFERYYHGEGTGIMPKA